MRACASRSAKRCPALCRATLSRRRWLLRTLSWSPSSTPIRRASYQSLEAQTRLSLWALDGNWITRTRRCCGWTAFALVLDSGYGDAPRNIGRGPNLWQADLALAKRIPIKESAQIQFRSEFFNFFNRAHDGQPLADFSSNTFGQIIGAVNTGPAGTGTPREIQFMLQLEF
jgi:hypothetical protein